MVTFNFKKIDSNARCQNYVEGYKAIDGEILAFYINHKHKCLKEEKRSIKEIA